MKAGTSSGPLTPQASITSKANNMKAVCLNIAVETAEKCEEIEVKIDEEFKILKRREIRRQTEILENADKRRRDNLLRDNRVFSTKLANTARLTLLQTRTDAILDVKNEVLDRLGKEKSAKYKQLLKNFMIQSLYSLMEPKVMVFCIQSERGLVSSCFAEVKRTYESATGRTVQLELGKNPLKNSVIGGLVVSTISGRASVDCRLTSRLEHVISRAMPEITTALFGTATSAGTSSHR
ncbi:Hypothetical protein NTJ_15173 [Nesidiocoris tenuis]|uniref:V-type proton ATPase subunit E n=1 Tax=Nesidiocoris tenuis TaxID=355587 RepID=A0ABN7BDK9_9HEMI|nr:Hypothetical protein NTJ_15173 [Nesidiocoris tenuis]